MITESKKPATYHERVQWSVAHWQKNEIHVFDTKKEARSFAKTLSNSSQDTIVIDWVPHGQTCRKISESFRVIDKRATPVY